MFELNDPIFKFTEMFGKKLSYFVVFTNEKLNNLKNQAKDHKQYRDNL